MPANPSTNVSAPLVGRSRRGRRLRGVALSFGFLAVAGASVPANATPAENGEHKVTMCHATRSDTNPYVAVTVDVASILTRGHDGHDGPVWVESHPKHEAWGDIIPAFDFGVGSQYPGQNVLDGQGYLDSECGAIFE